MSEYNTFQHNQVLIYGSIGPWKQAWSWKRVSTLHEALARTAGDLAVPPLPPRRSQRPRAPSLTHQCSLSWCPPCSTRRRLKPRGKKRH